MKDDTKFILTIALVGLIIIAVFVVVPSFIFAKTYACVHGYIVSVSNNKHLDDCSYYRVYFSDGTNYNVASCDVGDFDGCTGEMDVKLFKFTNMNMDYWYVDSVVKLDGWT